MAETRARVDPDALHLTNDIVYEDLWTDTNLSPISNTFSYRYSRLSTLAPTNGVINYPDHIQPIWNLPRSAGSCSSCHGSGAKNINNPSGLNLNGLIGTGVRVLSYNNLLIGRFVLDENGTPLIETNGASSTFRRALPLVNAGYARGSYLVEKIMGTELFAEKILPADGLDHSQFLSDDEKKLIAEWIDMGAQYFNSPFDENNQLRILEPSLSSFTFANTVHQSLLGQCGSCHALTNANGRPNQSYEDSNFILTGKLNDDFSSSISMVNDIANPLQSYLLARPAGMLDTHHFRLGGEPLLTPSNGLYTQIEQWISGLE